MEQVSLTCMNLLDGNQKAIGIIHYIRQFDQVKQKVAFTLILESKKNDWTKGTISGIFENVENRIKNVEYFKFDNYNSLDYGMLLRGLPDDEYDVNIYLFYR